MKKSKKNLFIVFAFSFLIIFLFYVLAALYCKQTTIITNKKSEPLVFSGICFEDFCFEAELAQSKEQREKGLMFREFLPENKGMLFDFQKEGKYGMWMKNTLIPLDMIWLTRDLEIVEIKENALPCQDNSCPSYGSLIPAQYVLEINAGKTKELGLKMGDKFYWQTEGKNND